jgi:hypothetical protein
MAEESRGEERDADLDAMGNDKRRPVIGQQYGATVRKRLLVYGAVVGVIVLAVIVFLTVVSNYDNRDIELKDTAPWSKADTAQEPPRDVDFKANGPRKCPQPCSSDITMPADEILNR